MAIPRIFQNTSFAMGQEIDLASDAAHHISRVLRLEPADSLILFNGQGGEYAAIITAIHKQKVTVSIESFAAIERESPLKIHLGQVISRGERMDFTIQKAVELGVHQITPLFSERCNVKLPADRLATRLIHWQKIAISACEQCGRNYVPLIHPPQSLLKWLAQPHPDVRMVLNPHVDEKIKNISQPKEISLLIGAEGGFSPAEIAVAEKLGFISLALGHRILRTETAGIVALTVCQYQWGDLGGD